MTHIVVVDDEELILKSVRRELGEWAADRAVELTMFSDPLVAWTWIQEHANDIELVLSDARMPGLPGVELLKRVRNDFPDIFTILFTGYADLNEVVSGVRAGVFSMLLKPWTPDYLIGEIEKGLSMCRMQKEHRENVHRMEADLYLAGQLQRALTELTLPRSDFLELSLKSLALDPFGCTGDYCDAFDLERGRSVVMIGDVAGHGVAAALIAGILKAIIQPEYVRHHHNDFEPAQFLEWLNRRLSSLLGKSNLFVTLACLLFDSTHNRLTVSLAGHPSPLLVRGGKVADFHGTGAALGAVRDAPYTQKSVTLADGDTVWVFTDGLIETGGRSTSEGFKAVALAARGSDSTPDEVVAAVLSGSTSDRFEDDVTLLKCRVRRVPSPPGLPIDDEAES